jgi:hypothetical protein
VAAEVATDPVQRQAWLRLALMWLSAARWEGDEAPPEYGN